MNIGKLTPILMTAGQILRISIFKRAGVVVDVRGKHYGSPDRVEKKARRSF